jgi:hypothetical protein
MNMTCICLAWCPPPRSPKKGQFALKPLSQRALKGRVIKLEEKVLAS